jgi:hypothetical protein
VGDTFIATTEGGQRKINRGSCSNINTVYRALNEQMVNWGIQNAIFLITGERANAIVGTSRITPVY